MNSSRGSIVITSKVIIDIVILSLSLSFNLCRYQLRFPQRPVAHVNASLLSSPEVGLTEWIIVDKSVLGEMNLDRVEFLIRLLLLLLLMPLLLLLLMRLPLLLLMLLLMLLLLPLLLLQLLLVVVLLVVLVFRLFLERAVVGFSCLDLLIPWSKVLKYFVAVIYACP